MILELVNTKYGDYMRIFTCKDKYEDMMTCIYDAWEWALKNGHDNLILRKEPIKQYSLFDEYVHIEGDEEKALKVTDSIRRKISDDAYISVYYATLSIEEDALDTIYRFLQLGFKVGRNVTNMLTEQSVLRMMELRRRVGNEYHSFREFLRFNSIDGRVFVAHFEPKNDVTYLVARHFSNRMPSENFMIIDDNRRLSVVHPKNQEMYIRYLNEDEINLMKKTEEKKDKYEDMWQDFFNTIAIKERENYKCQRNHLPLWMRKHMVELGKNTV